MKISLIIKRHWFDQIRAGNKKKEYRQATEKLTRQICEVGKVEGSFFEVLNFKPIKEILLLNGYHKNRPTMLVECTGIEIEPDEQNETDIFVFSIGKVLKVENC